ncbi:MAG: hypothetical protein GX661_04280 [Acholeplasmataceae bacterium]|nr:hypothetical protein [Acholeplasmataceae bacterium]
MELINTLNRNTRRRRIIEATILAFFFTLGLTFTILYQNSKVVKTIGDFIFQYEIVEYNYAYMYGIIPGWFGCFITTTFLLIDLIFCGIKSTKSNEDMIVIYRNLYSYRLYINGELKDKISWARTYLEAKMSDGSRVVASFQVFNSFHLTFSDNRNPIDL